LFRRRAGGAETAKRDFAFRDDSVWGNFPKIFRLARGARRQIGDRAAAIAEKMRVLGEVRAVPGRLAVVVDVAYEAGIDEVLQAIVNGRE
jgi:hypothetical protein